MLRSSSVILVIRIFVDLDSRGSVGIGDGKR